MNKDELIAVSAASSGIHQDTVRLVLEAVVRVVNGAASGGREVRLFGLGKLSFRKRGPKPARNLHTGETVIVPRRVAAVFSPSTSLVSAANSGV